MISAQKSALKLIFLGVIGGWLGGACVNASDGILSGLVHVNALKGGLVGAIVHLVLSLPWVFSIRFVEKISGNLEKPILKWGSDIIGGGFGVLSSILAVYLFFLFWPYEAHGRSGAYKTVMAIVGTNPGSVFGIGGLLGMYASSWIRPPQEKYLWLRDIVLPLSILSGLVGIVGSNLKDINSSEDVKMTPEEIECCSLAYQAFVKKVGVSYAIFEAEQYCEVECPIISDCLDVCAKTREACQADGKICKDAYRNCVLSCPNPE